MEGNEMAERFSQDQKLIAECVKMLIELYRVEEDNHDLKTWWKPESVEILDRLFKIIFGSCTYNKETRKYYTKTRFTDKGPIFDIDENKKSTFLVIMSNLWSACSDEKFYHFDLLGIENQTVSEFRDTPFDPPRRRINFPNWKLAPNHIQLTKEGQIDLYKIRNKALSTLTRQYKKHIGSLKVFHIEYMFFNVAAITEFAKDLLELEPMNGSITKISDPSWPQNNFVSLVRAVLVKFHIVFGDYARIKVCPICDNLSFEKKKNSRTFCSRACGLIYNRNTDLPLRKCRDKQNMWIKSKINYTRRLRDIDSPPSRVCKADCLECQTVVKGGACWFLRKKNSKVFELLENTSMQ
jgi:hypothetical protein